MLLLKAVFSYLSIQPVGNRLFVTNECTGLNNMADKTVWLFSSLLTDEFLCLPCFKPSNRSIVLIDRLGG